VSAWRPIADEFVGALRADATDDADDVRAAMPLVKVAANLAEIESTSPRPPSCLMMCAGQRILTLPTIFRRFCTRPRREARSFAGWT
jgi:hypothetical protein